jgi:hypothetical protein
MPSYKGVYMGGYKADGGVSLSATQDSVLLLLKSSTGEEIKTFKVPVEKADSFIAEVQKDEPVLRAEAGETDPLRLIKIQRCF